MSEQREETHNENYATCPWCGYKDEDAWEYGLSPDDSTEGECPSCEKPIVVALEARYYFTVSVGTVSTEEDGDE